MDLCFQSGQCEGVIEGEVQVGGQEHFYLEPQSSVVWTIDSGNEVHMICSTQVCFICILTVPYLLIPNKLVQAMRLWTRQECQLYQLLTGNKPLVKTE